MKKICSLFFALIMLFALSTSAFASEPVAYNNDYIVGTIEDDEGTPEYWAMHNDDTPAIMPTRAGSTYLFSMTAVEVYDFLTTKQASSDKKINGNDVSGEIEYFGTLRYSNASLNETYTIRGGLCYYDEFTGICKSEPPLHHDFTNGVYETSRVLSLSDRIVYYGFIGSRLGSNTTFCYGTLTYYEV